MVTLQEEAASAAVVYASATAMRCASHLSPMTRLKLWGEGEDFQHKVHFDRHMKSTSVFLEGLATELASRGQFVSRRLSLSGTSFSVQVAPRRRR